MAEKFVRGHSSGWVNQQDDESEAVIPADSVHERAHAGRLFYGYKVADLDNGTDLRGPYKWRNI